MTTNGQAPFVTVFMYLDEAEEGRTRDDLALIIEEMLKQRMLGVKNEKGVYITPAFPKLIYVLDEDNIHEDSKYWYLTKMAAECTAKRMVPDYISAKLMKEYKGESRLFDYDRRYTNVDTFTTALNQGLSIWCKRYGQERFTFYSARHSWATIGRSKRCNIDKGLITAGLCHVSDSHNSDDVYIRLDWEMVWDANAKILSVFDWK
jgi:anaerobic ribonucleoside-triphosphate reductase